MQYSPIPTVTPVGYHHSVFPTGLEEALSREKAGVQHVHTATTNDWVLGSVAYRIGAGVRDAQSWQKKYEGRFYRGFLLIFKTTAWRFFQLVPALISSHYLTC